MDLIELINQKAFLGQEFLTWLWYQSEQEEPARPPEGPAIVVMLGERLVLAPAQGAEGARLTIKGQETSLAEAREGLRRGKLVESLRLGVEVEGQEYWFTLEAAELKVSGLKTPPVAPPEDQAGPGDGPEAAWAAREGMALERVALIENALNAVEGLLAAFLAQRLDQHGDLAARLGEWAAEQG